VLHQLVETISLSSPSTDTRYDNVVIVGIGGGLAKETVHTLFAFKWSG
jgi:hypothetical protein